MTLDCNAVEPHLVAHLHGELGAGEESAVRVHLAGCAACRARIEHERAFDGWLRERLRTPAPAALAGRVREALQEERRSALVRLFGSPWTPRAAMAAVLAVVILVPLWWLAGGPPAPAVAAASRHATHGPGPSLPPCCIALDLRTGDVLEAPSAGVRVPDLADVGLHLVRATRCTFGASPVNALEFEDAAGNRFSLYIGTAGIPEFRRLRPRVVDGVAQLRHVVPASKVRGARDRLAVTLWERAGFLYTWVGPTHAGESAPIRLQTLP